MGADNKGPSITALDDNRITKIGKILRLTKVDELPSLINVIKGDMSLVGPRPETPEWIVKFPVKLMKVLNSKPGITGPSQIKYRNEEKLLQGVDLNIQYSKILHDKLLIDLTYIENQSFKNDLIILIKTIKCLTKK
jgi:lipopolysaccharide/colanic/teichoic acid biosynthesis glycosyltransferase